MCAPISELPSYISIMILDDLTLNYGQNTIYTRASKDANRTFKTRSEFWSQGPHVVACNACNVIYMSLYLLHEIYVLLLEISKN